MKFAFGSQVKDVITGFTGTAIGITSYITGCTQILVTPKCKDGDYKESHWFDEDRLELISAETLSLPMTSNGPDIPAPLK